MASGTYKPIIIKDSAYVELEENQYSLPFGYSAAVPYKSGFTNNDVISVITDATFPISFTATPSYGIIIYGTANRNINVSIYYRNK